jgi:hypothetical protein
MVPGDMPVRVGGHLSRAWQRLCWPWTTSRRGRRYQALFVMPQARLNGVGQQLPEL